MTLYDHHTLINIALYDNLLSGMPLWCRFESYPLQPTILIKSMTQITLKDFGFFCVLSLITKIDKKI